VLPAKWSVAAGKAKGNSEEARALNYFLDALKQNVYNYQWEIVHEGLELTTDEFRKKWLGLRERPHYLLEVFKQHNDQLKELIEIDCSKATFASHIFECLLSKYHRFCHLY
jgi:hypothetical protein